MHAAPLRFSDNRQNIDNHSSCTGGPSLSMPPSQHFFVLECLTYNSQKTLTVQAPFTHGIQEPHPMAPLPLPFSSLRTTTL